MYGVHSGVRKGNTITYGEAIPKRGFLNTIGFWLSVKDNTRFCVDVYVVSADKQKVLLGKRDHRPAQAFEWPGGGGLSKGEFVDDCAARHAHHESGIWFPPERIQQIHLWDLHFDDSNVYEFVLWNFKSMKKLVAFLENHAPKTPVWQKLIKRASTHTPALAVCVVLTDEEMGELNQNGMSKGELEGKHWVSFNEVVVGDFDVYVKSNIEMIRLGIWV